MERIINKTMDRSDLLTDEAQPVIKAINHLIEALHAKDLYMTSWRGTLPKSDRIGLSKNGIKNIIKRMLGWPRNKENLGIDNRGPSYRPLCHAADDNRLPWYLYWETFWVIKNGPQVKSSMKMLDAGGVSSLFTCYLASLGCEVHSVDINRTLISNGNKIAKAMGWDIFSYPMNLKKLRFKNEYFDHAYSICVFEHLDFEIKQLALGEIARCLKPNGILSVTFDYRNPAPAIAGAGPDTSQRNQITTTEDIRRNFLSTGHFELLGNQEFYDNGQSYLVSPAFDSAPYTFGAIFLKKKG